MDYRKKGGSVPKKRRYNNDDTEDENPLQDCLSTI